MGDPPRPFLSNRESDGEQRSGAAKAGKAILVTVGIALSLLMLLVVIVIGVCSIN